MNMLHFSLAFAGLALSSVADAQRAEKSARSYIEDDATKHHSDYARVTAETAVQAWRGDEKKRLSSYAYRPILRFAECVARLDDAVPGRVLSSPLTSDQNDTILKWAATANRGCIVEQGLIHPLLLRAAFAETQLKDTKPVVASSSTKAPVGVPRVVNGYPLGPIAECQVRRAPKLVRDLLATQPGDPSEREAAEVLFKSTAECGAAQLGRLSSTAARLALVEAEYVRRFIRG